MYKNNMNKRFIPFLIIFAMILSLFTPMVQQKVMADSVVSMSVSTYGSQAYKHINHLSKGLGGARTAGSQFEKTTANYIKEQFESYNYETSLEEFSFIRKEETFNSQNIVAIKKGKSEKQVIVGAHMDQVTSGGSEGAHDNASGIGTMLEVAERLKDIETDYTIRFIAFGAEEVGLKGSAAYVEAMADKEIANTIAMINLDSVIAGDYAYVYAGANGIGWVRDHALNISEELGLDLTTQTGLNADHKWGLTGNWSDHAHFNRKDIPVAYFESTNWLVTDGDIYTDGYIETMEHGSIMHTERDNLDFIEANFPGRVMDRLNTNVKVLEKLLVEIADVSITISNTKVSMTEEREIDVELTYDYVPKLEELEWTLGDKAFDQWKKWDNEERDFVGEPWISFSEEPTIEGNKVKAKIKFDLPFDTVNLSGRPYPRTAYPDLIGFYDLKVTDSKVTLNKELKINAYDNFHTWEEIKPAIDKIIKTSEVKEDRYFEYSSIGKSVEGRDMHFVVIAKDKEAMDKYLNTTKIELLNNPKDIIEKIENNKMNDYQVPIFINNVHPDESPAVDAQLSLMELFATKDEITFNKDANTEVTLKVDEVLDDLILVFNLTQNPDGRYHNTRANVDGFDLNRDNGYQLQKETKNLVSAISNWNPLAFIDLHGFVSAFLIEPCTPPHEPNFEYDLLMGGPRNPETGDVDGKPGAIENARAMGEAGVANTKYENYIIPLFDYEFGWDDAAVAYTGVYALIHGALGHTVEIPESNQDSNDAAVYAVLGAANYIIENKDALYKNQLKVNLRGIENEDNRDVDTWHIDENSKQLGRKRGANENFFPEYYILPVDESLQKNPLGVYNTLEYLFRNGAKAEVTTEEVVFNGVTYPVGSIVVPLRQAKRGIVNAILYDGSDESIWEGMYAELVMNFPAMRGFDKVEVREKGLFDNKTKAVTEVNIPKTKIEDGDKYVIRNSNNEAIKAVNQLLNSGKAVHIITGDSSHYNKGDFVVSKENMDLIKNDYFLSVSSLKEDVETKRLLVPKISSEALASQTKFVLRELGFEIVEDKDSNIIVDSNGRANKDSVEAGIPYVGIGTAASNFIVDSELLPGLEITTTGRSHEGLLKGHYSQDSIITESYDKDDFQYIAGGTVITKVPSTSEVLAEISNKDDFYIAGWWPGHEVIKGQTYGIKDESNDRSITLFSGDVTNKAHPEHLFRLLSNSIYASLLEDAHWAEEQIKRLFDKGVIVGYPDGSFKAESEITRAEFTKALVKVMDLELNKDYVFNDTENHWAKNYISTAYANKIVDGIDKVNFGPDELINREQMVTMISRAFELEKSGIENDFVDKDEISQWAEEAIVKALEIGIISGYPDSTFKPKNNATRAEAMVIIVNSIDMIK